LASQTRWRSPQEIPSILFAFFSKQFSTHALSDEKLFLVLPWLSPSLGAGFVPCSSSVAVFTLVKIWRFEFDKNDLEKLPEEA
jgi:hypothetical protein